MVLTIRIPRKIIIKGSRHLVSSKVNDVERAQRRDAPECHDLKPAS